MNKLAVALLAIALLAGCGNAVDVDINGRTGISVNAEGKPVVLVAVCHSTIDEVTISADRTGLKEDEPNPILGTWTASKPLDGLVTLDIQTPGADWKNAPTFAPEDARGYIVIADQAKADVEASQVAFKGSDLADLTPETVRVDTDTDTSETWPRDDFLKRACANLPAGGY